MSLLSIQQNGSNAVWRSGGLLLQSTLGPIMKLAEMAEFSSKTKLGHLLWLRNGDVTAPYRDYEAADTAGCWSAELSRTANRICPMGEGGSWVIMASVLFFHNWYSLNTFHEFNR